MFENTNDFENTFRIEWTPPFGRLSSRNPSPFHDGTPNIDTTYRSSLLLVPTENHDLVDDPPAVDRDDDGLWRLADGMSQWLPEQVRLQPGEMIHGEYAVVGHPDGAGQGRPPGIYEFSGRSDSTLRLAVSETAAPGPNQQSRFAGRTVPSFEGDTTTAWYHEADATATTYLHPDKERGALPLQVEFTFVNKSRSETQCGHWNLYKLVDGQWFHIGPYGHTADCRLLAPGQTKTWILNAYPGEALPSIGYRSGATFGHLGGGTYGVVAGYGAETSQSGALVKLEGDAVAIEPTDDLTVESSGTTVRVRSPRRNGDAHTTSATLTLTRASTADRTVIPEQVLQERNRGLRNTVALLTDDVETVTLRTSEQVAEAVVGYESDRKRYRIHGVGIYEASIERHAE